MRKIFHILFLCVNFSGFSQHIPLGQNCKETTAWLNVLGTYPAPATFAAVNQFVTWELNHALWSTYDRFWLFAQDDRTNALISIINPTATAATEVSTLSWTAYQGFTPNGTSGYINTQFTPSTDGVKFTRDDASQGIYITTNVNEGSWDIGVLSNAGTPSVYVALASRSSNTYYGLTNVNGSFTLSGAVTDSRAFFMAQRTSSTSQTAYYNAAVKYTETIASQPVPNIKIYIGCINNLGTAGTFASKQYALAFFGQQNASVATQYADIQQLATMLGFKQ